MDSSRQLQLVRSNRLAELDNRVQRAGIVHEGCGLTKNGL
jgi:hypothetical protein